MFAKILKDLRAKSGLSQGQLAKAIGVSPGNISDWEVGKTKPGYTALASLACFFEVSSDYLLDLDGLPVKTGGYSVSSKDSRGLLYDERPLEGEEVDLIAMYRLLPDYRKEDAFDVVCTLYQKHVERKKESIYWTYKKDRLKQKSEADSDENSQGGIA